MKILDVLNSPWAILPTRLTEIQGIYIAHLRGPKIKEDTIKAIEAEMGRPLQNEKQGYEVVNGSAIIPIQGVIAKRMNLFSRISGGASTELIGRDFIAALNDPAVRSIILDIDSPGGSVDGTQNLSALIYENRGRKPVYAFCDGMMASAAYWIGSAADRIFISSDTVEVGSIGVVASHVDVSKNEEMSGVKTTEITAGKYKRIASQYSPLSKEGREYIQEQVDYLYAAFAGDVARNRDASEDDVISRMADGRLFIGNQAIEAGLVDGVSTLDGLISELAARAAAGFEANASTNEEAVMTKEEMKAKHPDLYKSVLDEGFADGRKKGAEEMECPEQCVSKAKDEGREEGASTERGRIQGVFAQAMPGHEALISTLAFDGKTTGPEAAVQILAAEKSKKGKVLEGLKTSAPEAVADVTPPAIELKPEAHAEDKTVPVEERAKATWEKDAKIRSEFTSLAAYTAYRKAEEKGQVRIFSK